MNWSSLRSLMVSGHERFIIVENDTPEFVILSLEEYQRLMHAEGLQADHGVNDQLQGIAQDTSGQDAFSAPLATGVVAPERLGRDLYGGIHLEDLPL